MSWCALSLALALGFLPDELSDPYQLDIEIGREKRAGAPAFLGAGLLDAPADGTRPGGARIAAIQPGSTAARSDLQRGDVIVEFNGKKTPTAAALVEQLGSAYAGQLARLHVWRGDKELTLDVLLGARPKVSALLVQRDPPRVEGEVVRAGGGVIDGDVTNYANYVVRESQQIRGEFVCRWTSVLEVEITGRETKSFVGVEGDVRLGGLLCVTLVDFKPKAGDRFELISNASSLEERFSEVFLPKLEAGLHWQLDYDDVAGGVDLDQDGKYDVTLQVVKKPK